jgi:biopolymer transport protein ExbD
MDLRDKMPARKGRIEIVPLIDCMFLLLVFFVYSMMTLTQPRGIPVKLPPAADAPPERKEFVAISITETGQLFLEEEQVGLQDLEDRLAQKRILNPSLRVLVNGDRNARHGQVVQVLDVLRRLSIQNVAIQTGPKTEPTDIKGK